MKRNPIIDTDSYKASHWLQYPPNTETIFSYIEARGGKFPYTRFFGLQAFIKEYLLTPITMSDVLEADEFWKLHGEPFNLDGWKAVVEKYNGYLPLKISAVPEGTVVPIGNVLVTVENTDPEFYWLTSYIEPQLLRAVWYPTTVCTTSYSIREVIKNFLEISGDEQGLPFKLHDFGARGVSSYESSVLGGMAHLVNFMGTDTAAAILGGTRQYYHDWMSGFSIPAAEHSSITSWGKEGEIEAYRNMLRQFGGEGKLLAVVSDSYDIFKAAEAWGTILKKEVVDSGSMVVIRPDSGDPVEVCSKIMKILGDTFGYTKNAKGYKVLNNVRVIQGDGVDELAIRSILGTLVNVQGWSADNIAFGMGGALLQRLDRDTQKWAMKCSAAKINGEWIDVFKDPITDSVKKSKKGRLMLFKSGNTFVTDTDEQLPAHWTDRPDDWKPVLRPVFENGKLLVDEKFSEIRARA